MPLRVTLSAPAVAPPKPDIKRTPSKPLTPVKQPDPQRIDSPSPSGPPGKVIPGICPIEK